MSSQSLTAPALRVIVAIGLIASVLSTWMPGPAGAQDLEVSQGGRDQTFGLGGQLDLPGPYGQVFRLADGSIGAVNSVAQTYTRVTPDGVVAGPVQSTMPLVYVGGAFGVADGGFVQTGTTIVGGLRRMYLAKYSAEGVLDLTFGSNGFAFASLEKLDDDPTAYPYAELNVGRVVESSAGTYTAIGSFKPDRFRTYGYEAFAVRISSNGQVLTSGDHQPLPLNIVEGAAGLSDGTIVLASRIENSNTTDSMIYRIDQAGNATDITPALLSTPSSALRVKAITRIDEHIYVQGFMRSDAAGSSTTDFLAKFDLEMLPVTSFASGGLLLGQQDNSSVYGIVEVAGEGLVVSPPILSLGQGQELVNDTGEVVGAWHFGKYAPMNFGDSFVLISTESFVTFLERAAFPPQNVGDVFEYPIGDVAENHTVCVATPSDSDTVRCSAYSAFGRDARAMAIAEGLVQTARVGSAESDAYLYLMSETECGASWFPISGWDPQRIGTDCDLLIGGPGQPTDPVYVLGNLIVEDRSDFEGLNVFRPLSNVSQLDRVMFANRGTPTGNFQDGIRFNPNPTTESYGAPRVSEAASMMRWAIDTDDVGYEYDSLVRAAVVDFAYTPRGFAAGRGIGQASAEPNSGRREFGVDAYLTVVPEIRGSITPRDSDSVETDSVIAWVNQPGGSNGWDPGEPFDIATSAVLQPLRMVAMGDSFAAGEGGSNSQRDQCARSPYSASGQVKQIAFVEREHRFVDIKRGNQPRNADFAGVGGPGSSTASLVGQTAAADTTIEDKFGNGTRWLYAACGGGRTDNIIPAQAPPGGFANNGPDSPGVVDPLLGDPAVQAATSAETLQLLEPGIGSIEANVATLTIGGNDAGFSAILEACLEGVTLARSNNFTASAINEFIAEFMPGAGISGAYRLRQGPQAFNCADAFPSLDSYPGATIGAGGIEKRPFNPSGYSAEVFLDSVIRLRLRNLYREVNNSLTTKPTLRSEHVFVFGYPMLFGEGQGCAEIGAFLGDQFSEPLTRGFFNGLQGPFNDVIKTEAEQAGFTYVDPIAAFGNQGICGDTLNGVRVAPVNDWKPVTPQKSFHPTDLGHLAYVDAWVDAANAIPSDARAVNGLPIRDDNPGGEGVALRASAMPVEPSFALAPTENVVLPSASATIGSVACNGVATLAPGEQISIQGTGPEDTLVTASFRNDSETFVSGQLIGADELVNLTAQAPLAQGKWTLTILGIHESGVFAPTQVSELFVTEGERACAEPDFVQGSPGQILTIQPGGNDGTEFDIASLSDEPTNGVASIDPDGQVIYTPNPGFAGADSMSYEACTSDGFCSEQSIEIDLTVGCDIVSDGSTIIEGTSLSETICGSSGNEYIVSGGGTDVIFTGGGADIVTDVVSGVIHADSATIEARITPGVTVLGGSADLEVTHLVVVANNDSLTASGLSGTVQPLANDTTSAAELDNGTLHLIAAPEGITATIEGAEVTFTAESPVENARIFYTVCNTDQNCDSAAIKFTATGIQNGQAPQLSDDEAQTEAGQTVIVDVLNNDTDPDNDLDISTLAVTEDPSSGTAAVIGGGTNEPQIEYRPAAGFSGVDEFVYRLCDQALLCSTATVQVTVLAPDTAPEADVIAYLEALLADPGLDPEAVNEIEKAIDKIYEAIDKFGEGDTEEGIGKLEKAIEELDDAEEDAPLLDLSWPRSALAGAARSAAVADIDEATFIHPGSEKVAEANVLLGEGDGLRDAGDYAEAAKKYKEAAKEVEGIVSSLPLSPEAQALVAASNAEITGLNVLLADLGLDPESVNEIEKAIDKINEAIDEFVKGHDHHATGKLKDAIKELEEAEADAPGLDLSAVKLALTEIGRSAALSDINEARASNPTDGKVIEADAILAGGDALRDNGIYSAAAKKYEEAANKVQGLLP